MNHLPVIPVLLPLLAASLLLMAGKLGLGAQRILAVAATSIGLLIAILLLRATFDGTVMAYNLGDWPAPFGIVFVADKLAALMVLLVYLLGLPALLMATGGTDGLGRYFHPLFQLQLAGLSGAFLTGDIFNLFVFFEILLIASYTLLVHGGGANRARAGLSYVVLNLVGSSLFLVAVAFLYGTLGTLNIADLSLRLAAVPAEDVPLVRVALATLAGVFLLKGALAPMTFWLPHVYSAASAPVAALFAIMTKVGIIALLRLVVVGFGDAEAVHGLLHPWLPLLALATIFIGSIGLFAARRLAMAAGNLVLISSGTLLFAVAFADADASGALLFYLPHSVLVTAGFLLLAGQIAARRGSLEDRLVRGPAMGDRFAMGVAYATLAVSVAGLPPLSGFLGKIMLMQDASPAGWAPAWWAALLLSTFVITIVLARSAALLFWQADDPLPKIRQGAGPAIALWALVLASPILVVAAIPLSAFANGTAAQLHARTPYMQAVLPDPQGIEREVRP